MNVVLGFFGLTRSLRRTAGSIRTQIVDPLHEAGFGLRRAGHFNLPGHITNPRSGELGIVPDRTEAALLDLDACLIEKQDDRAVEDSWQLACAFPDAFGDGYRSLRNLCHQLRSLDRLWSLIEFLDVAADDIVIFLRPDLLYLDRLDVRATLAPLLAGESDIVVPSWQSWGGANDRFAFATADAARIYATRWRQFADACLLMGGMHSERFLDHVIRSRGLRTRDTDLRAVRMRADGRIAGNDVAMLAAATPQRMAHPAMGD